MIPGSREIAAVAADGVGFLIVVRDRAEVPAMCRRIHSWGAKVLGVGRESHEAMGFLDDRDLKCAGCQKGCGHHRCDACASAKLEAEMGDSLRAAKRDPLWHLRAMLPTLPESDPAQSVANNQGR